MSWIRRLGAWLGGGRKHPPIDVPLLRARIQMEMDEEDRLFDEYLELPDRPIRWELVRITEADETGIMMEMVDFEHWEKWKAERQINGAGFAGRVLATPTREVSGGVEVPQPATSEPRSTNRGMT